MAVLNNATMVYGPAHNTSGELSMDNISTLDYLPEELRFNDSHVITITAYSFLMVFSAIGNLSVLRSISRQRVGPTPSRVSLMILHLAIGDLLVTFLLMPLEIGWAWTVSWNAGDFMCRLMAFFRTFGVYLSGFILIAISVDRYQSVICPLTVTEAKKRVKNMLWTSWFMSAVFSTPQAVIFHVETHPHFIWFEQCVTFNAFPSSELELAYSLAGFIAMYAVPLTAIIICYGSIVCSLYRSVGKRQTPSMDRTKRKTLNMTLTIVLAFFFCWTPYNIMSLWYFIDKESAQHVDQRVQAFLFIFAVANSTVNPIVYGYFNCHRAKKDAESWGRVVYKSPFRQHIVLCKCNTMRSSSSDLKPPNNNKGKLHSDQIHKPLQEPFLVERGYEGNRRRGIMSPNFSRRSAASNVPVSHSRNKFYRRPNHHTVNYTNVNCLYF